MKELSIEEKAKRYDEAIKVAENIHKFSSDPAEIKRMEQIFPELAESEDERIRKAIIEFFELQDDNTTYSFIPKKDILTWLEKQGENANFFNKIQIGDKVTRNRDGVLVNLSQLNRVAKPAERQGENSMSISEATKQKLKENLNKALEKETPESWNEFLEKQGTPNQTSIWKHWKDGIAGGAEGEQIFLIKIGRVYTISSCLGCECDYILLSDLDKLMLQEKQGEQKPADKVEPKFKVGDWIIREQSRLYDRYIAQVTGIDDGHYYYDIIGDNGNCSSPTLEFVEKKYHLWTIQDAKDGDVLICKDNQHPFIFKGLLDTRYPNCPVAYCGISSNGTFDTSSSDYLWTDKDIEPATKEQRDLLFTKIKEAGYEWDAEKKELKEIIDENQIKKNLQDNSFRRMFEQKPICNEEQHEKESLSDIENRIINFAMQFHDNRMKPEAEWEDELKMLRDNIKIDLWSKEDVLEEKIEEWLGCEAFPEGTNITPLPKAMEIVRETANHFYDFGRKQQAIRNIQCTNSQVTTPESYINEGQKKGIQIVLDNPQEYGLQKPAEWSKEDEKVFHAIRNALNYEKPRNYLKSRDFEFTDILDWLKSLKGKIQPQPKQEWSEEDEDRLQSCLNILQAKGIMGVTETINTKWLKSLKERYTWKPSNEQMSAIDTAINVLGKGTLNGKQLIELQEQLMKLRGE